MSIGHIWKGIYAEKAGTLAEKVCPACCKKAQYVLKTACGEPRNLMWILHWDGFRANTGGTRSSGVIDVTIATMRKCDRAKLKHDFLVCFVPVGSVKENGIVHWLAPFLEPLVKETEKAFVNGDQQFGFLVM
jgi:hypothetical protein